MNNTAKDKYDHKLIRFMKEYDKIWEPYSDKTYKPNKNSVGFAEYEKRLADLFRRYNFTVDDFHRAIRLRMHMSQKERCCLKRNANAKNNKTINRKRNDDAANDLLTDLNED